MVTKVLHLAGLYLGDQKDLMPASPDNPDGFWEHLRFVKLNDDVLNELGGGWDHVPDEATWRDADVTQFIQEVSALRPEFDGREPWGWKDPRNSITLPFWLRVFPGMKVVICIRNPLEVAVSLYRRNYFSMALSLNLWEGYNKRLLEAAPQTKRIITHYETFLEHPQSELRRLAAFLELPLSDEMVDHACSAVARPLRHNQFTIQQLRHVGVSKHLLDLYLELCSEAGRTDREGQADVGHNPTGDPLRANRRLNLAVIEAELARRELADRDARIVELRTKLEGQTDRAKQEATRTDKLTADLRKANEALEHRQALDENLNSINKAIRGHAVLLENIVDDVLFLKTAHEQVLRHCAPDVSKQFEYQQQVHRIRQVVQQITPADAVLVVISKGDDDLLRFSGRRGWHFPQTEAGGYAGTYPANGSAAVAHLESLRARGADYLVIPETSLWWLDHYPEFAAHLRRYRQIACQEGVCRIIALGESVPTEAAAGRVSLDDVVARCMEQVADDSAILDWNSGLDLSRVATRWAVFSPPESGNALPYLDRSVAVVAVPPDPSLVSEARRVARAAVLTAVPANGTGASYRVDWLAGRTEAAKPPAVTLIVSSPAACSGADRFWDSLIDNLPDCFMGEIVTDSDVAAVGKALTRRDEDRSVHHRLVSRHVREPDAAFFNRAAEEATGDVLIFLTPSLLPLSDWLLPLCDLLLRNSRVGAIGGKVFAPDGRLESAGVVIFSDGSAQNFGSGDYQVDNALYEYVREVPCCSSHVLATGRALFDELGGFDPEFQTSVYAFTDYCFRVRGRGWRVCYQPESRFVLSRRPAVETASPADADGLDRDAFRSKWGPDLGSMPRSRPIWDRTNWHTLAVS